MEQVDVQTVWSVISMRCKVIEDVGKGITQSSRKFFIRLNSAGSEMLSDDDVHV